MIFRQTISMPAAEIKIIQKALAWTKGSYYPRLDDGDVIASRTKFDDGFEMDVVCMGACYDPLKSNKENAAIMTAHLFKDGNSVAAAEETQVFRNRWKLSYQGNTYIATLKENKNG